MLAPGLDGSAFLAILAGALGLLLLLALALRWRANRRVTLSRSAIDALQRMTPTGPDRGTGQGGASREVEGVRIIPPSPGAQPTSGDG